MGETLPNHHEDHIAGKGNKSLQHSNLVHKFIPMPQAFKIPGSKSSSGQGMGKIGENFGVEPDKSQKQERSDRWPGGWGPQGMSITGGGGLARVPKLRVREHLPRRVAPAGREG